MAEASWLREAAQDLTHVVPEDRGHPPPMVTANLAPVGWVKLNSSSPYRAAVQCNLLSSHSVCAWDGVIRGRKGKGESQAARMVGVGIMDTYMCAGMRRATWAWVKRDLSGTPHVTLHRAV